MSKFALSDFLKFEEKNYLFDITIDNWKLWPYLRFTTYTNINDTVSGLSRKYKREKPSLNKYLSIIKNCTIRHPLLFCRPKKILVFTSTKRVPTEEGYKCPFTDDLIKRLDNDVNAVELISQEDFGHKVPCYTKNIMYCDFIDVVPEIVRRLLPLCKYLPVFNEVNAICKNIVKSIKNDLDIDYDLSKLQNRAQAMVIWHYIKKKKIQRLLKKIQTRSDYRRVFIFCNPHANKRNRA